MWAYRNPVDIRFGNGSFAELGGILAGRSYALVTYDEPFFAELNARLARLAGSPAIVIRDVAPNPDFALLAQQTARFAALPRRPEVIVALGGGSVIDSAKVFAASDGDFAGVRRVLERGKGGDRLTLAPVIAVPTTAGTGSEVTCWATVWDAAGGAKYSLSLPGLYPEHAVIDPELMLGKPRGLTIATGLDALSHALESLWNRNANPVSMACAVRAATETLDVLPRLAAELGNLQLRSRMARAAVLAGLAFSNTKTAIAHSLSYPITLRHGVPHGIACSFSLPMIMRSVAHADGICGEGLRAIFGDVQEAPDRLAAFLRQLGVDTDPRAHGVSPAEWSDLLDTALAGERGQNFIGTRDALIAAASAEVAGEHRALAE